MSQTPDPESTQDRELIISRVFDAPRQLVYEAWTTQEHTEQWFVPTGCKLIESKADVRVGGAWTMAMHVPSGELFRAGGVYKEVVPNGRLAFTHAWEGDDGQPEHWTLITVDFADSPGGRTEMTFKQAVMKSIESREGHRVGWSQCFDHLDEYLAQIA